VTTYNNSINAPFPFSPTIGGTGVASPTAHGLLIGEGSSAVNSLVLSAGQVAIGTTSGDPTGATLTAGTNINITSATGSITIATTGFASFAVTDVSGTTQTAAVNSGYIADNAALVTITLPATAAEGSLIEIIGKGAGLWKLAQPSSSSQIIFGNQVTTVGTSGYLAAQLASDCCRVFCTTTNNVWTVAGSQGNIAYN
jgi:hypothetical protein